MACKVRLSADYRTICELLLSDKDFMSINSKADDMIRLPCEEAMGTAEKGMSRARSRTLEHR